MPKPALPLGSSIAWRGKVAWRAVLAILANYGLAALMGMAIAKGLPHLGVARAEATVSGALVAIIAMPILPIFIFAARTTWRPTAVMAGCAAVLALIVWLPGAAA